MSKFSFRTAAIGITVSAISAFSLVNGNLTSVANRSVGQAEITIYNGDFSTLNAGIERFAGWKIFSYKIWDSAGKVAVQAVAAAASYWAVDQINGPAKPGKAVATTGLSQLSDQNDLLQQSILLEELN